jgi:hypothetical protein
VNALIYPVSWTALESPSQCYELILTLEQLAGSALDEISSETADFIVDDVAARQRPVGIVGGCLIDEREEGLYFEFLDLFERSLSTRRATSELRQAADRLLAQMRTAGMPASP